MNNGEIPILHACKLKKYCSCFYCEWHSGALIRWCLQQKLVHWFS